jgi:hypothetical protein
MCKGLLSEGLLSGYFHNHQAGLSHRVVNLNHMITIRSRSAKSGQTLGLVDSRLATAASAYHSCLGKAEMLYVTVDNPYSVGNAYASVNRVCQCNLCALNGCLSHPLFGGA